MSRENVEIVRRLYADWERGDFDAAQWAHPDIEWVIADGPTPGTWKGRSGMTEGWREFLSAWEGFRVEPDVFREIDSERVLVLAHFLGRGKMSGLRAEQLRASGAHVVHVRDGKVTRSVTYFDRAAALEAVGLSE